MGKRELAKQCLMSEVAYLYYKKKMTQEEIGQRMFLSRTRISRLLQQAHACGIVEVRIRSEAERNYALEEIVQQRFRLKKVLLYNSREKDETEIMQGVAALAAGYLREHTKREMTIGISWGRSVSETVNALHIDVPFPVNIAQIMGFAATDDVSRNCNDIASRLASKFGGRVYYLNTPLVVEDPYVRQRIMTDPVVSKTLEIAKSADIILTGIGTVDHASTTNPWQGYMDGQSLQEIQKEGGVGCIGSIFFNREGKKLNTPWNEHCIGITLEEIKRMDEVIAVAWGERKSEAILGAMTGRLMDVMVSDIDTMEKVLTIAG